jgi:hypothetical protein
VQLSFPINKENCLLMAAPVAMDSRFCEFCMSEEAIYLGATDGTNQNLTASQKELLAGMAS